MSGVKAKDLIDALQNAEDARNRFGKKDEKYWEKLKDLDRMAREIGAHVSVDGGHIYLRPNK